MFDILLHGYIKVTSDTPLFHCVKIVQIRSFFWSLFSCIRTEYGDFRSKSPYSVQRQENTDQKKLRIWILSAQLFYFGIEIGTDIGF